MGATGLLITIAFQVGSALSNSKNKQELNQELTALRKKDKEERQKASQRREYERSQKANARQMELEEKAHQQRLEALETDFMNNFKKMAEGQALNASPLRISPYVIRNTVMPLFDGIRKEEVFCILTNSNDDAFNRSIIPILDQLLFDAISDLWNKNSLHTICYYTNVWKSDIGFTVEQIDNMMALFMTPTVTITPYVTRSNNKNQISIIINIWSKVYQVNYTLETPVAFESSITQLHKEEIKKLAYSIFSHALCAMGYSIDLYYWNTYNQPPLLPRLISTGAIQCDDDTKSTLKDAYIEVFKTGVLGCQTKALTETKLEQDSVDKMRENASNTLYCSPDSGIGYLQSISSTISDKEVLSYLLSDTLLSIYKARFGEESVNSLADIDSNKLTDVDVDIVLELMQLAKNSNCDEVEQGFKNILRRVIDGQQ